MCCMANGGEYDTSCALEQGCVGRSCCVSTGYNVKEFCHPSVLPYWDWQVTQ